MNTVPKQALRNPLGWVAERSAALGMTESAREDMLRGAETLVPLTHRLRGLDEQRGRTSYKIGAAKASGTDTASLVAKMRNVVADARAIERELRSGLEALLARHEHASTSINTPKNTVPAYFGQATRSTEELPDIGDLVVSSVRSAPDREDYIRYLHGHPARTAYHELGLCKLIASANHQRSYHLIARSTDGAVRGLLPLVRLRTSLFGDYLVSMPWFNYGGPLAEDATASEALARAAGELAHEHGCSHAEIRETAPRTGWAARTDKVSMTLPLPGTVGLLEKDFGASLRAQSNKAERAGCTFRAGGRELVGEFYRVFAENMRDLGTPVQSLDFYEALLALFGDDAFITVVSHNGKPLAAASWSLTAARHSRFRGRRRFGTPTLSAST